MELEKKSRLDQWLVDHFDYDSRSRARETILRRCVSINGKIADKAGQGVTASDLIEISDPAAGYVSRAALKLEHGLKMSDFNPTGKVALDIGASTGGFTQVLLNHGAKHVWCVDVGRGQLHPSLISNPNISNLENLNVRELTTAHIEDQKINFLVSDVSFISLKIALPSALSLCASECKAILLIKPQFEAGRDNIGKGGLVKSAEIGLKAAEEVELWINNLADWQVTYFGPSPIEGGDGNIEYILAARKA